MTGGAKESIKLGEGLSCSVGFSSVTGKAAPVVVMAGVSVAVAVAAMTWVVGMVVCILLGAVVFRAGLRALVLVVEEGVVALLAPR